MPPQSTSPCWTSTTPASLLFLGVFLVATVCVYRWPDEGHVASSTEATGIDAEAVVASLVAERREHAALAAHTQATESATIDAPANGETPTESPGGNANSNQEQEEAATATPAEPVGEAPTAAKGTVILPVLGETPLPEPEILDLPAPEVSARPLPALPDVPLP
jgi:hypothetical protein